MTVQMNTQEAKTHLSRLIALAMAGDVVVIAHRGVPQVRLVPCVRPSKRELGFVGGEDNWDDAFFEPLPEEELAAWGF